MRDVIPQLTFTVDCFQKCRHVNIEVMRMVRPPQLNVTCNHPHTSL